jgi:tRNA nucleotidyltransferase (CCA-adding enzyme)
VGLKKRLLRWWRADDGDRDRQRRDRATDRVRTAVDRHVAPTEAAVRVLAVGAYASNTNVRPDGPVDILVECTAREY